MLAVLLILILCLFIVFFVPNYTVKTRVSDDKDSAQTKKLWGIAQTAIRERKPVKAEKALLTILKFDEKNAAAYNRLGIIYAKSKRYDDAIECFEIAQSLDNNTSSLHNVGLIYYETGRYEKAAQAFERALEGDGGEPARHIAYAKALEKIGKTSKAVEALESAYELKQDTSVLEHLLELYENQEDAENIELTKQRIKRLAEQKKKLLGFKMDKTSAATVRSSRADKANARASARAAKVLAQKQAKEQRIANAHAAKQKRLANAAAAKEKRLANAAAAKEKRFAHANAIKQQKAAKQAAAVAAAKKAKAAKLAKKRPM